MRKTWIGLVLVGGLVLVAGCTPAIMNRVAPPKVPAGVEKALPSEVAGPPETLQIPHQTMPPVIMAVRYGSAIELQARARWHGQSVDLYYLPAHNVYHRGERYEIKSAKDVQKIATVAINPDGKWTYLWNSGDEVPKHDVFFILGKSNTGDYGLVQVNTVN